MSRDFRAELDELQRAEDELEQKLEGLHGERYVVVDDLLKVRARDFGRCVWCTREICQPGTGRPRSTCGTGCRSALSRWNTFAGMNFQTWGRLPALPPFHFRVAWPDGQYQPARVVRGRAIGRSSPVDGAVS